MSNIIQTGRPDMASGVILGWYNASLAPAGTQIYSYARFPDGSHPILYYFPPAAAGAPPATPAPAAAFSQISANTVGSTVMVSYGTQRLGGQQIWSTGIEANPDAAQTGLITAMYAFCEPADSSELIRIQKVWANGTPIYNFDVNPTAGLTVENLTPDAQAALDACMATMVLHKGGPGELPDPTMVDVLGETEVPAHRGLRTVTFIDFPTLISGNSPPQITILFKRTDTILVRVDACFQKIVDNYIFRTGVNVSFEVVGIDDECYGATVTSTGTVIDMLAQHAQLLNYQIIDGDPIKIVRKAISSGLVVDLEVAEADVDKAPGTPTIPSNRLNPSQLPIGVNWNYSDPDADFDMRMQPALHEGTSASTMISSVNSMFTVDRATARQSAFDMLYRLRAHAMTMQFELDNVQTEVSDILLLTMADGDRYTLMVQEATHTKSRATQVRALALLTEAGSDIDGGLGLGGGTRPRIYWPEQCAWFEIIPTPTRIWSNRAYSINYNSNPPARRISSAKYASETTVQAKGGTSGADLGAMFEDNTFVYWLDIADLIIYRCRKSATNVSSSFEALRIEEFIDQSPNFYHSLGDMAVCSVLNDGKLYVAWAGPNGASSNHFQLVVVDLVAWSPSSWASHTWWTDVGDFHVDGPVPVELAITDNGTVVIVTSIISPVGRAFYTNIGSLGSFSHLDLTVKPQSGTSFGNVVYCQDGTQSGAHNLVHKVIVLDCATGAPIETIVDLTSKDANIVSIGQRWNPASLFCSPTHLFIACNYTLTPYTAANNPGQAELPYLARLDLGTLNAAGGKFMSELIYAENELNVVTGKYLSGKMYLTLIAEAYDGRVLVIDEDLSPASGTLYPTPSVTFPANDAFDAAIALDVDSPLAGNLFYASMDSGEPIPTWGWDGVAASPSSPQVFAWARNAGHSVWFSFQAPATGNFKVEVSDFFNGASHSIQVYTGTAVGSLSAVAAVEGGSIFSAPTNVTFAATALTTYMISIRHDSTNTFGGFSYQVGVPGEREGGDYTITITAVP